MMSSFFLFPLFFLRLSFPSANTHLVRRSITAIKVIDLLQENISLVSLKTKEQNIDSIRFQIFTFDIQTCDNSNTE